MMGTLKRKITCSACAVVLALGTMPLPAFAESQLKAAANERIEQMAQNIDAQSGSYQDGAIIVVYADDAKPSRQAEQGMSVQSVSVAGIPDASAEVLSRTSGIQGGGAALHVDLPENVTVGQAVAAAQADPNIVCAQPIFTYHLLDDVATAKPKAAEAEDDRDVVQVQGQPLSLPNDEYVKNKTNSTSSPNQWWIHSVKAPDAWDLAHADNKVTVAVLDTGINFDHSDLKNNILQDYAYDSYLEMPLQDAPTAVQTSAMAHGSHVAGIVAGEANNSIGIAGVTYNANILPICVFHEVSTWMGAQPTCSDEDLIRAYDYLLSDSDGDGKTIAQATNTRVINMSLGGYIADDPDYEYDYAFEAKIHQAQESGILTVAAAGNGENGYPRYDALYPSDYADVMSVISLKSDTQRSQWSDANASKNISAPGENIYSTWYVGDQYQFDSGTSMASPLVAGCAALLWAYNPDLTVADVKEALYSTAVDLGNEGFDMYYGHGRVDLAAAIKSLGAAYVSAEKSAMVRTTTQQLEATVIDDPAAQHTWKWSVLDPASGQPSDKARVSPSGVVTAVDVGTVEVHVEAADDSSIAGKRTITIEDIAVPDVVSASANPSENSIALRWQSAEGAVSYRVLRADASNGPFAQVGTASAASANAEDGTVTYVDRTAAASVDYWYKVVPVGSLDGVDVVGVETEPAHCFYTDKTALRQKIEQAESLLANTQTSADGSDIPASQYWVAVADRVQLNLALRDAYGSYYSGVLTQAEVDAAALALTDAIAVFQGKRHAGARQMSPTPQPEPSPVPSTSATQVMYRLYNPYTGEHFYTASSPERSSLVQAGWKAEGTAWNAPEDSDRAVYRLYNPNAGDHHYTTDATERNYLVSVGWRNEGIGWMSDDAEGVGLYRLYNPNATAGAHHYTSSASERDYLVQVGWKAEGIGWYGAR